MLEFDPKDVFYLLAGGAFFGLTVLPIMCGFRLISVPTLYVAVGMVIGVLSPSLWFVDPMSGEGVRLLIEHLTELIVIVSLAGAGLAVDRAAGRREWQHTWMLLGVVMPVTIVLVAWAGMSIAGLSLAAAVLLGGCLTPTDPVLARSVQVDGPNEGDEDDVRLTLTTEAGVNDGLAFPVIWLAIVLTSVSVSSDWMTSDWLWSWVTIDVGYRLATAVVVGWLVGRGLSAIVMSRFGDFAAGGQNAGLVMLACTFLVYGITESLEGYGFLAVFVAAVAGRGLTRGNDGDEYVTHPHRFSEQIEKILLAMLLLWLGVYAVSGILEGTTVSDVALAVLLIFVIRPLTAFIALMPTRGTPFEKGAIAFFGIRGLGSFFYIAFAQGHGDFPGIDGVWRIAVITVLMSILVHGMLSPVIMRQVSSRRKKRLAIPQDASTS